MKIAIDCGHTLTGSDYGASGIREESNLTREVGNKVINLFKQNGHEIINCTVDNCSSLGDSLYRRYNKANENNCDYYISIHFNAFNGSGKGTEILYASSSDDKMQRILNNIVNLGYSNRGLKKDERGLAVLRHTRMKAMLIECCFCDNQHDMSIYNADKMAKAIVEGFLGKSVKTTNVVNTSSKTNSKPTNNTNKISTHLRDWQQAYNSSFGANIIVDGIRGQQVETAMTKAILKVGSNCGLVGWLQCRVHASIDNKFGQQTLEAVKNFQRDNNLVIDGVVGYNTWNALFKKYNW